MTPEAQAELTRQWRELDESEQMWAADFEDYMTMVLRAIEVGGVDHICFGADWDGGGGLPGIADISALPKVTERLKQAGYSDADLEKMWRDRKSDVQGKSVSVRVVLGGRRFLQKIKHQTINNNYTRN